MKNEFEIRNKFSEHDFVFSLYFTNYRFTDFINFCLKYFSGNIVLFSGSEFDMKLPLKLEFIT